MAERYPPPVFLDATVISNFASTRTIEFLVDVIDSPAVAPAVREEIERGVDAGHGYLSVAVEFFDRGLPVREVPSDGPSRKIRSQLDPGEAESILGALEYGGTVATDDLAARKVAESEDVPVTGSIGLLILGVERGRLDSETADEWLDTWRERRGYYAPVESVSELLEEG